jgi:cytoskeletal protein RodZ
MPAFTRKPVLPEYKSLGDELRLERERRGEDLKTTAANLKIKPEYIRAIEEEDWQALPPGLYGRIFFKKYLTYLGLNHGALSRKSTKKNLPHSFNKSVFFNKVVKRGELRVWPLRWRNLAVTIIIVICFLYLLFYLNNIFSPPPLTITAPNENVSRGMTLTVAGKADPETEVTINDNSVLLDKNGNFSEVLSVSPGVKTITVKAKKKYSRERVITKQVLVEQP